ncbi:MAG: hypothetical protein ABIQ95_04825, partial [Bdellovibrionia bacterium]
MNFRAACCGFALVFGFLTITGCSPGMFFGGKDQGVLKTPNYRRLNLHCADMDLSSSTLDVPKFREILHCFNSNGALEPIDKLVGRLSDPELEPIVTGANKHLLNNQKKLYQIDQTYHALENKGIADSLFLQMGKLLENEDLISSGIAIFREGFKGPLGHDILVALELVARDLSDGNMSFALDLGSSVTSERSFRHLREDFSKAIPSSTRSLAFNLLIHEIFNYVKEDHTYQCGDHRVPISRELIQSILVGENGSTGDLFSALDEIVGVDEAQVRKNILPMVDIFRNTLSP